MAAHSTDNTNTISTTEANTRTVIEANRQSSSTESGRNSDNCTSESYILHNEEITSQGTSPPPIRESKNFSFSFGLIVSCLGCVLGTGNIWRFPRILALASSDTGSLTFLLAWIFFLGAWSIPLIITEYTIGRFTKGSPVSSFYKFLGEKFLFVGSWVTAVAFFISAYFSVVVGWCFYYFYLSCSLENLPDNEQDSTQMFNDFIGTYYPLWMHLICVLICGFCVFFGVKGIEIANSLLVPVQLFIVIFTFYWSLTRDYASIGIKFMFTPQWDTLRDPQLYVEAACQNAFDTAAGMGLLSAYAAYFSRNTGAVRYGVLLPIFNNLVSLTCGIMIFATVFSTLIATSPTLTFPQIVKIMQESGPGSTGLTFAWIPVLLSKVGPLGRALCGLFFLCLSFAGITSMIGYIELTARTMEDFGIKRLTATIISLAVTFCVGAPSAINIYFLKNQDFVWGFALMISGLCYCLIVFRYGPIQFRKLIVNKFGTKDWRLPFIWIICMTIIIPIEAIALILWWAYQNISTDEHWYEISAETLMVTLLEWLLLFVGLKIVNLIISCVGSPLFSNVYGSGYDPYHIEEVPSQDEFNSSQGLPFAINDNNSLESRRIGG